MPAEQNSHFPGITRVDNGKGTNTGRADYLFKIKDKKEAKSLEEERVLAFHHTVAQLLFMSMQARRDIQTTVAFLTTQVKKSDEDDWGKLKRVLKYLNGTTNISICI